MKFRIGKIQNGDCVSGMNQLPAGSVDLAFADPPFNIGYKYDVYEDRMATEDYLKWSEEWMAAVYRALKSDGTFWLAIGDDFAAELKLQAQKTGFHCRSWVIWYYTFGVNCRNKFTRSHTHLFYFVKDREQFTFQADDLKNRVPSARALVYGDKRANSNGRLPDDTWIIPPTADPQLDHREISAVSAAETFALRPQELKDRFQADEDTWYIPRVAGTFKERAGFHGCQMPEQLLGRIIRMCSQEGEIVMDPFSGSASTLVVARKLGRLPVGFELSEEYTSDGQARLDATAHGDRLDGSPEPTMESFTKASQPAGARKSGKPSASFAQEAASEVRQNDRQALEGTEGSLETGLQAAFSVASDGYSVDRLLADPDLSQCFADECQRLGLPGNHRSWNHCLMGMRKRSSSGLRCKQKFSLSYDECEPFLFASEVAWKKLVSDDRAGSLDEILCDPFLAAEFDETAQQFAPGFSSLQYRWGALRIRKYACNARTEGNMLQKSAPKRLGKKIPLNKVSEGHLPDASGVYLISEEKRMLYIGSTFSVRDRVDFMFRDQCQSLWSADPATLSVQYFRTGKSARELTGWTSCFLAARRDLPEFNVADLRATT